MKIINVLLKITIDIHHSVNLPLKSKKLTDANTLILDTCQADLAGFIKEIAITQFTARIPTINIDTKNHMREDLELQSFAESKGWEIRKHICDQRQLTPRFPIQFHKKNKVIWKTSLGWACADVVDTPCYYSNHRYRKSLREVLECESK